MGTLALRIAVGLAAAILASAAAAQVDPATGEPSRPATISPPIYNEVALRDRSGNFVTMSYGQGRDGSGLIRFVDAEGRRITVFGRGRDPTPVSVRGSAPVSGGGAINPLFGESFPPLPDTSPVQVPRLPSGRGGLASERSDTGAELLHLVRRVNDLTQQVQLLTKKLDAAARKR